MPEENAQIKEQLRIEKIMLLFYFVCSVAMTIIAIRSEWSNWLALLTDAGWLFGFIMYYTRMQTFSFRAYATASLMQMGVILWSVGTASLSMTAPILLVFAVMFVFYGIPEIIYITVIVSIFLDVYHLFIRQTIDFSSGEKILQTVLEIVSVFFIEYVVYVLNKKRLESMEKQTQIIDSLKEAERSKDDFLANVSHEIRTPINTICGMSEIILREELTTQVRADVFGIQTAGRSLQSIVTDVLDFTEMQSGKMTLVEETYNITSTINDVINMSMARKSGKPIDLLVDCDVNLPSSLKGDEQKIRRIIMNLVNNALKFTVEGCVSIHISSRKAAYGVNLIVCIKDTGIGMKKESLEKLFTSFTQVDTKRNRQKEGMGLGLAISQALVEMLGGFITVSSEFGRGSEIQFVIPQKVVDPAPIAVVRNRESINAAIYIDMEKYDHPEVREAYSKVIYHMIVQLKVKCHFCHNLAELRRRADREIFTHVFISIEEYEEDREYFDTMSETTKVVIILERHNDEEVSNPKIRRLYKPFFVLPIVMALNDEDKIQEMDISYYHRGKFIAPDITVLVVDDNLMNIRVLEGLLRPYKIQTAIATSGAEALDKIESMNYDAVLMDHMMPEMDGVETLKRIRQKQGNYFKKIPIIAVTANAVGGMREMFLNEGFQDFIAKPIEVSVLERVLKRNLPQEKLQPVEESANTVATEKEERKAEEPKKGQEADKRNTDLPEESFNEQLGLQYCGGLENYIEVLRLISMAGPEDRNKIGQLYETKDWKNYTTLVHALKSTMMSVGVEKLSGMAKELELAGKRNDEKYILEHHDAMMEEYAQILDMMKKSRTLLPQEEQASQNELEVLEEEELDRIALEFEDAAFAFDHDQMTAIAERLSKCSFRGHSLSEMMETVIYKIEMSDYLSASEVVSRLKDRR
ncbi:MAG: response regulator [Lachnospiraceae bacterium]|nr:response regulator [Lachnospiraceae bacterium]